MQVYRLSGLVPGSLGLVLADLLDWSWIFPIMAAFMLVGVGLTLSVKEAVAEPRIPPSLAAAVAEPFREFFARRSLGPALAVLAFMFFYKLGDNMATALSTPFYIDLGFSPTQIGVIAKNAALWPSVIGGLLGGLAIVKIGINKALWLFGGVQLATIFGFVWLSGAGADPWVLAAVISAGVPRRPASVPPPRWPSSPGRPRAWPWPPNSPCLLHWRLCRERSPPCPAA